MGLSHISVSISKYLYHWLVFSDAEDTYVIVYCVSLNIEIAVVEVKIKS